MQLSSLFQMVFHLAWAIILSLSLKFVKVGDVSLIQGNEFILTYFILVTLFYTNILDKFNKSLIIDPVRTSYELLKIGLNNQSKLTKKGDSKK